MAGLFAIHQLANHRIVQALFNERLASARWFHAGGSPWVLGLDCRRSVGEAEPLARGSRQKLNLSGEVETSPQIPLITFTKVLRNRT